MWKNNYTQANFQVLYCFDTSCPPSPSTIKKIIALLKGLRLQYQYQNHCDYSEYMYLISPPFPPHPPLLPIPTPKHTHIQNLNWQVPIFFFKFFFLYCQSNYFSNINKMLLSKVHQMQNSSYHTILFLVFIRSYLCIHFKVTSLVFWGLGNWARDNHGLIESIVKSKWK